jgi:hypothetical protein
MGRRASAARRGRHWQADQAPGHDLRMYEDGRPTAMIAREAWDLSGEPGARVAHGPELSLLRAANRLVVMESGSAGRSVRMQLPLESCVDAAMEEGPGLPGMGLVCLNLSVRMGDGGSCRLRLWFHNSAQALLRELVDEIAGAESAAESATLPPLAVRLAPDDDWIVFRSAEDGVIVALDPEEQP